jgi:hypothetical protein
VSADPEEVRKYRPVTMWFLGIVAVVIGLSILGEWLRKKYG